MKEKHDSSRGGGEEGARATREMAEESVGRTGKIRAGFV